MYKCIIIGAGNKGALSDAPGTENEHKHISYAHAIQNHPNLVLAGFIDCDNDAKKIAEDTWGITSENRFDDIDIVIITTPDDIHHISLIQALLFKPKLVICEKPLCGQIHVDNIREIYNEAGIPILVNYTRRFIPYWQEIKRRITEYGEFCTGYLYYNRGLMHTASHFIDFCSWIGIKDFSKIDVKEVGVGYQWVFDWSLFFQNGKISEQIGDIKTSTIPTMYDDSIAYTVDNAYSYLNGGTDLLCTLNDAYEAITNTLSMPSKTY